MHNAQARLAAGLSRFRGSATFQPASRKPLPPANETGSGNAAPRHATAQLPAYSRQSSSAPQPQTSCRSPSTLSMRLTAGQYLLARVWAVGVTASAML